MGSRKSRASIAALALALVTLPLIGSSRAYAAKQSLRVVASAVQDPSSTENELYGVTTISSTDAWAVGDYADDATGGENTLVLHWDGTQWSQVPSPNPSSTANSLVSVRAITATDVWAVGTYNDDSTGTTKTLVLHWDGAHWSQVSSPNPGKAQNDLQAVDAQATGGVWAVGSYETKPEGHFNTLVLHWNGSKMVRVSSPNAQTGSVLMGVRVLTKRNAWAVGYGPQTFALHWNGSTWSRKASPNPFDGNMLRGTDGSASNIWAVGQAAESGNHLTLIERWNGTKWKHIASPNPSPIFNELDGVQTVSGTEAWTVGYYLDTGNGPPASTTLILRWNGAGWSQTASPNPGSGDRLTDVAGTANDLWTVGFYNDDATHSTRTLILHWNGSAWELV